MTLAIFAQIFHISPTFLRELLFIYLMWLKKFSYALPPLMKNLKNEHFIQQNDIIMGGFLKVPSSAQNLPPPSDLFNNLKIGRDGLLFPPYRFDFTGIVLYTVESIFWIYIRIIPSGIRIRLISAATEPVLSDTEKS